MAKRSRPFTVATRVDARESRLIEAASRLEGQTVSDMIRDAVLPHARERLAQAAVGEETEVE